MKWWRRFRAAFGLQSRAARRGAQLEAIEERMASILSIPPTRIDAFVKREDPASRSASNGAVDASHPDASPE